MTTRSISTKVIIAVLFLIGGMMPWQSAKASLWENPACQAVSSFVGAIAGAAVGTSTGATGWIAIGLVGIGTGAGGEILYEKCDATMDEIAEDWDERGVMDYGDFLDDYCGGSASDCPDPLLGVSCGPFSIDCSAPWNPLSCELFMDCLPSMTGFGNRYGASVADIMGAMHFIEDGYLRGSWDRGVGHTIEP